MATEFMGLKIRWLGHDGFRITDDKSIVIDPYKVKKGEPSDIILISHEHFDHCSPEDIKKFSSPNRTTLIVTDPCRNAVANIKTKETIYVKPGDEVTVEDVKVRAVPAYNVSKFREPGVPYHPKAAGGVGYLIEWKGVTMYHTGDSDFIQEMRDLKVDVMFVPVSGTFVMTSEEAARAVNTIKPKLAIPMHYGAIIASEKDAEDFARKAQVEVRILRKEE